MKKRRAGAESQLGRAPLGLVAPGARAQQLDERAVGGDVVRIERERAREARGGFVVASIGAEHGAAQALQRRVVGTRGDGGVESRDRVVGAAFADVERDQRFVDVRVVRVRLRRLPRAARVRRLGVPRAEFEARERHHDARVAARARNAGQRALGALRVGLSQ